MRSKIRKSQILFVLATIYQQEEQDAIEKLKQIVEMQK